MFLTVLIMQKAKLILFICFFFTFQMKTGIYKYVSVFDLFLLSKQLTNKTAFC